MHTPRGVPPKKLLRQHFCFAPHACCSVCCLLHAYKLQNVTCYLAFCCCCCCLVFLAVELTYNYGVDSYDIGEGFGHFGVALPGQQYRLYGQYRQYSSTGSTAVPEHNTVAICP